MAETKRKSPGRTPWSLAGRRGFRRAVRRLLAWIAEGRFRWPASR